MNYQRFTPGFALAGNQFTGEQKDEAKLDKSAGVAGLLEASADLHPVDFNYGNAVPVEEKTEEELKDARHLAYELKMLEKREMNEFMQKKRTGFYADHTYEDDDEFFAR